jgi:hypothetical protein
MRPLLKVSISTAEGSLSKAAISLATARSGLMTMESPKFFWKNEISLL